MSQKPVRVLFIAGLGRSGSTLLNRLLGQVPGCISVGELKHIWYRGFIENQLCSCHVSFRDCSFWNAVWRQLIEAIPGFDAQQVFALSKTVERIRYIPLMIWPVSSSEFASRLKAYGHVLHQLYSSILDISGSQVAVDSSKDPSYAFLLATMPGIEMHLVHLVRDSRGVAYSWTKKKLRPEITTHKEFMPQYNPAESAFWWNLYEWLIHWLSRRVNSYLRVRYEDLVEDPEYQLRRILQIIQLGDVPLPFIHGQRAYMDVNHTVSGNPMRFQQGWIELCRDDNWREQMNLSHKLLVTTLTLPGLVQYSYLSKEDFRVKALPR